MPCQIKVLQKLATTRGTGSENDLRECLRKETLEDALTLTVPWNLDERQVTHSSQLHTKFEVSLEQEPDDEDDDKAIFSLMPNARGSFAQHVPIQTRLKCTPGPIVRLAR